MKVPVITKRRAASRQRIEDAALQKAVTLFAKSIHETTTADPLSKAFLTGNSARMPAGGMSSGAGTPRMPGTSWSNQTQVSSSLISRVTQNLAAGFGQAPEELELALAEQGLSWGPPFPPGRPLDPFFGYRRPPRTFDYAVGTNVQLTPRWNRVSFNTIKEVYNTYDVAQICVRHLINDVRSLDYNWEPIPGVQEDVADDIKLAVDFWDSPDKRQPFRAWLAEYLQDVLRYDAGALYLRCNEMGDVLAVEVVDGTTIIPLVDFYGRRPEDEDDTETPEDLFTGEVVPAYLQIIEGLPWDWLAANDLIYQPWNPLPESQYGLAPLEAVLLSANTDIRFQWHFLQFFTEGTLPAGFMEAPPDQSDPSQIEHWQETWDAIMMGDQSKLRQIRWVPQGSKFTAAKPDANSFDSEFPLYLMRRTCAAYGVTPNDLGYTETVNRATGDTQIDIQFRVGTSPVLRHTEDVINLITRQYLKLRCRLRFDDGRETEDRVATAQAHGIYLDHGVVGVDEVRQELGKTINKDKPVPRYVNNSRTGPIPLIALESMAGEIDPDTYARADGQELINTPYSPPAGVLPPQGSPEQIASGEQTAQQARNLVKATTGQEMPNQENAEQRELQKNKDEETEDEDETTATEDNEPEAKKDLSAIDWRSALDALDKMGVDNTGGPGVTRGITVNTGIKGNPVNGEVEDDDDDDDEVVKATQIALSLRRWRQNSNNRMRKGKPPKRFVDPDLPQSVHDEIWKTLSKAQTREEVNAAFADVGKAKAGNRPAQFGLSDYHRNTDTIVSYYAPLIAKAYSELWSKAAIDRALKAAAANKRVTKESDSSSVLEDEINSHVLQTVLEHLQGDAALQGAMEAAISSGGRVADAFQCVVNQVPEDYWDKWQPGFGRAATQDLASLRDAKGIDIQGLTDSAVQRVDSAIQEGIDSGDSFQSLAKSIVEDLGSMARSETVANTEYARAMTEANLETYAEAGADGLAWLAEDDACEECEGNEDASPIEFGDDWPYGDVPVHPNCRCAIAPVIDAPEIDPSVPESTEKSIVIKEADLYSDKSCSVVTPELPPGATGEAAEARSLEEASRNAVESAKTGDVVNFSKGVDAKTGTKVDEGRGRVARTDSKGNLMVNAGTKSKPKWVQTHQRDLVPSTKAEPVDNPLGRKGYRSRLTSEESKALNEYKANGYRQLNSGLRSGKPLGTTLQSRSDAIDRAIEKGTLSKDTRLHRAFRPDGGLQLKPGDVITDKAFVSTSEKTQTPLGIVSSHADKGELFYHAHINAPAGTHVAYIDAAGSGAAGLPNESEILLPRGMSFRVVNVTTDKYGTHELELELIPPVVVAKSSQRAVSVVEDESTLASVIALDPLLPV